VAGLLIALASSTIPASAAGSSTPCSSFLNTLNRPTTTNSACVTTGTIVEAGVTGTRTKGLKSAVSAAQIRAGLGHRLELDLTAPAYTVFQADKKLLSGGYGDATVGLKYQLHAQPGYATSLDLSTTVPTGTKFSPARSTQYLGLNATKDLPAGLGLGVTAGYTDAPGPANTRAFSVYAAAALSKLVGVSQLFVDGAQTDRTAFGRETTVGAGIQSAVNKRLALDLSLGRVKNAVFSSNFLSGGLSVKF
jgi:hypothetical protein